MCNCKVSEIVLGLIILVFAFWHTAVSDWIIGIAAILLILHGLMQRSMPEKMMPMAQASRPAAKKKVAKKKATKRR